MFYDAMRELKKRIGLINDEKGLPSTTFVRKSGAGFTIIEMVISIFILSVAVIALFGTFSIMVILSSEAEDRLIATYLAQEGIEIIRNIRDNNWLASAADSEGVAWDQGLGACYSAAGCEVDYRATGFGVNPAYPWQDRFLKTSSDKYFYGYDSGTETKFKRKITIDETIAPHILKIKADVFWKRRPSIINPAGGDGTIEAEDILYNWY